MSQLRASVENPDTQIILWFKLGKYWSCGPPRQASRPQNEENGFSATSKQKTNEEEQNMPSWPSGKQIPNHSLKFPKWSSDYFNIGR